MPDWRRNRAEPFRIDGCNLVQRGAQGLSHQLQAGQLSDIRQDRRRVGPLFALRLEVTSFPESLQHPIQEALFGLTAEQPGPELGQDAVIEARVGELQAEGILPVDAAAYRVGGLPIGEVLHELENGD